MGERLPGVEVAAAGKTSISLAEIDVVPAAVAFTPGSRSLFCNHLMVPRIVFFVKDCLFPSVC